MAGSLKCFPGIQGWPNKNTLLGLKCLKSNYYFIRPYKQALKLCYFFLFKTIYSMYMLIDPVGPIYANKITLVIISQVTHNPLSFSTFSSTHLEDPSMLVSPSSFLTASLCISDEGLHTNQYFFNFKLKIIYKYLLTCEFQRQTQVVSLLILEK